MSLALSLVLSPFLFLSHSPLSLTISLTLSHSLSVYLSLFFSHSLNCFLQPSLGLIPIKADPNKFDFVVDEEETDADTLVFHLEFVCPDLPQHVDRDADGFPILSKYIFAHINTISSCLSIKAFSVILSQY